MITTALFRFRLTTLLAEMLLTAGLADAGSYVNFESGHTRPLSLSPDGTLLFAVNTPDDRLAIFEVTGSGLILAANVRVGLEPVAVASRVNVSTGKTEAWVVNHLSDSVSVVEVNTGDLASSFVKHTLLVGDEPRDIVFAGSPLAKAFITTARRGQNLPSALDPKFLDEGTPRALVWVFSAENVGSGIGGTPSTILELFGDSPRALAASPDGSTVYAAIFQSGNGTAMVRDVHVEDNGGSPPLPADSPFFGDPDVPTQSLIVKHDPVTDEWNDELERDWTSLMMFSLPDKDVFALNADANPPVLQAGINSYSGVGTTLFNMAVRPGTGSVFVSNSNARNHVRFAPIEAGGVQGHVADERITVLAGMSVTPVAVNPHIDYDAASGPASEIDESVAMLGDLVFSADGTMLFAAALGSDQVAVFDAAALEGGTVTRELVDVGRGPSGIALDEANDRLYVMNRFDHSISIVTDASVALLREATSVVSLGYDPTPDVIRDGRPILYDARGSSGHGDSSCATCHVFGDADQLAWDLGDPYGSFMTNPNPFLTVSLSGGPAFGPFHPLKGPMVTQSLRGLDGAGPMHWRGDRTAAEDPGGSAMDESASFKKFNPTFVELLGRPSPLTPEEMQAFTDFVLTMRYPPNPVRALDGRLNKSEQNGRELFLEREAQDLEATCVQCHALPLGTSGLSANEVFEMFKVPHLRAVYQKAGMFGEDRFGPEGGFLGEQVRGFGYLADGVITLHDFLQGFVLGDVADPQEPIDIANFLLAFDTGLHPAVGQQVTIGAAATDDQRDRLELLIDRDEAGECDLTFEGRIDGVAESGSVIAGGRVLLGVSRIPPLGEAELGAAAAVAGGAQTWTCRAPGTGAAATIDRDGDGVRNGDEVAAGTDPLDSDSVPFACVGGSPISAARMKIVKNGAPVGDEKLSLKTSWTDPAPVADPSADGMHLIVRDATTAIVFYQELPASRWTADDSGVKWAYTGAGGDVISKARLSFDDGLVKLDVKGRGGAFSVSTAGLTLEVLLGGNDEGASGECVTGTFGTGGLPACELSAKKLGCQ